MPNQVAFKDTAEKLDYSLDWGKKWLAADDYIIGSSWETEADIDVSVSGFTDDRTTVWIEGGEWTADGYLFTNTIVTSAGRVAQRSIRVHMVER